MGDRFTDLLALVNGALATWPVLRRDGSPGAKADYVAVCLYLGTSDDGAVRLNSGLRNGQPPDLDGYLPCLVAGIRQLPLHRRAVVCQARLGGPVEELYPVGTVLTEPAFRSASVTGDVAAPESDVDFVIWPRTARQAYVLVPDRGFDEAVFGAGSRFKVLAVDTSRATAPEEATSPETTGVRVPDAAVLLRELLPYEPPATRELDDADREALRRLDGVLRQRRQRSPRAVEDADLVARLAGSPLGYAFEPLASAIEGRVGAA
jgi:hypothetical protein